MSETLDRLKELSVNDPDAFDRAVKEVGGRAFVPHDGGQKTVLESEARFRALAAGRRWGKTKLGAHEIVKRAKEPNQMLWWVANTYKNVGRGYREVVNQLPPSWLAKPAPAYTSTNKILQLKNGTYIEFYSGGNPDALAGEGVDFCIVDEAGLIENMVWQQLIRPTLMDKNGDALLISTPRGHNWFWEIWRMGQDERPGYESWQFPQTMNPYVTLEETKSVEAELPKIIFEQEIMAKFLAAGASIFGLGINRPGAVVDEIVEPHGNVFMGIDLAKKQDFTVIAADREVDRKPCHFERFTDLDWPSQQRRIAAAILEMEQTPGVEQVTVMIDSTGLGEVVFDNLVDMGLDVESINLTNQNKEEMARLLATDLEKGQGFILTDMLEEFESYEFHLTPSGNYVFEAASGHDDMVIAKMLAHWAMVHKGSGEVNILGGYEEAPEADLVDGLLTTRVPVVRDSPKMIMGRPDAWGY